MTTTTTGPAVTPGAIADLLERAADRLETVGWTNRAIVHGDGADLKTARMDMHGTIAYLACGSPYEWDNPLAAAAIKELRVRKPVVPGEPPLNLLAWHDFHAELSDVLALLRNTAKELRQQPNAMGAAAR
ncbi:hypothetical protein LI90_4387 (plasmid) [Carbonactinospora thermoautotrophica]|uniref:Uncharacterized protein n=1 Tax=Carbonactinospora thermoautotrophica TaxID=1469144 RepID=A0A132MI30_9ACTN|nr:hypothetical protein [Carbonactinospora thermoautotrophica]KWW97415.1 hypothetical protein LI90_4387 [Carbonactinospora thermoautotrophica]